MSSFHVTPYPLMSACAWRNMTSSSIEIAINSLKRGNTVLLKIHFDQDSIKSGNDWHNLFLSFILMFIVCHNSDDLSPAESELGQSRREAQRSTMLGPGLFIFLFPCDVR
jgi:hypothetical protein